jgi:L-ribulokinase
MAAYALGLDFGTNSVRAVVVDVADGTELGSCVHQYARGEAGILLSADPNLARQHPADYLEGVEKSVRGALASSRDCAAEFDPSKVIGAGVATTGSTPLPVDAELTALALKPEFSENLAAMAWLWKDHTAHGEAEEITALARETRPEYLAKCGGVYSSEWFFSKILRCLRSAPEVFAAADSWVELADWLPAVLCGRGSPAEVVRGVCAAGHKAMYHPDWGGLPDAEFLARLDVRLGELRARLYDEAFTVERAAGELSEEWAGKLGLPAGIPVAVGAFDAHLGAVGSGIKPGVLVKILGTSCCDMMVAPLEEKLPDIPGLCGIVPGSILPGHHGLEAGQSAFGDIYNWFTDVIQPGGAEAGSHAALTAGARKLRPGQSGLLALDWNNGNRTVLVDQRLTGLLVGQTLHTTGAEIYRALVEATAFGALTIMERFEEYDVAVREVVGCGGIAEKNPLVMQILADVSGRRIGVARSSQACALGAAVAGAVVAGAAAGGYDGFAAAQEKMTGLRETVYSPDPGARKVYARLYALYRRLHDAFGTREFSGGLYEVMKELIAVRTAVRGAG